MTYDDLVRLLKSSNDVKYINEKRNEAAEIIPQIARMFDYDQRHSAHQYDLWMHCLHTAIGLPRNMDDDMVYLAALLHDIGKPDCQVAGKREDDTNMHYYGHPERSMEIVRDEVIPGLLKKNILSDEDDRRRLIYYVEYHDDRMSVRMKSVRRHVNMGVSLKEFQNLMLLQVSDATAHVQIPIVKQRIEICGQLAGEQGRQLYNEIVKGMQNVSNDNRYK